MGIFTYKNGDAILELDQALEHVGDSPVQCMVDVAEEGAEAPELQLEGVRYVDTDDPQASPYHFCVGREEGAPVLMALAHKSPRVFGMLSTGVISSFSFDPYAVRMLPFHDGRMVDAYCWSVAGPRLFTSTDLVTPSEITRRRSASGLAVASFSLGGFSVVECVDATVDNVFISDFARHVRRLSFTGELLASFTLPTSYLFRVNATRLYTQIGGGVAILTHDGEAVSTIAPRSGGSTFGPFNVSDTYIFATTTVEIEPRPHRVNSLRVERFSAAGEYTGFVEIGRDIWHNEGTPDVYIESPAPIDAIAADSEYIYLARATNAWNLFPKLQRWTVGGVFVDEYALTARVFPDNLMAPRQEV